MSGNGDPRSIVTGLRKAADERRVLVYSADAAEEADIATTGVSGAMTEEVGGPSIGVFLNDGTEAKLGYYLHNELDVSEGECNAVGRRELLVRVVLHYDPPADGLPAYVTGSSPGGKAHALQTNVLVFAPSGGSIAGATGPDGAAVPVRHGEDHSREVGWSTVTLTPGASAELTFTVWHRPVATVRSGIYSRT